MRKLVILLGLLVCVSAVGRAQGVVTPGRYQIEIVATGKVLDLRKEDKRTVQQYALGGARNQQWDLEDAGGGYFYIRSADTGKALDALDGKNRDGVQVIVADKRDADTQKWRITDNGNRQYTIISKAGRSLESPAGKRDDGVSLQIWGPHGLENQRFRLTRVGDLDARVRPREGTTPVTPPPGNFTGFRGKGRYQIQIVASGNYLDARREDNQTLQQWSGSGAKNQLWDVEDLGNGYFMLRNVENGRYLEAGGSRDGASVFLRDRADRDVQRWRIVDAGNGESVIISRNGKVLDLPNGDRREGQPLQLWGEHRRENQRFRFSQLDTRETFAGGRRREGRGPEREPVSMQEPYTPGRMTWRGRVDIEVLLEVRGSTVTERSVSGRSFNNGKFTFSGPIPARELDPRIENRKVRGSVVIVERPTVANNFTTVIRVSDPDKDAADYEFVLIW